MPSVYGSYPLDVTHTHIEYAIMYISLWVFLVPDHVSPLTRLSRDKLGVTSSVFIDYNYGEYHAYESQTGFIYKYYLQV
jgi:hypothetical protein